MRLLYTGDYSRIPDRHMPPADLPEQRPHIVIVESTYGVSRHLPREEREQRFVERIHTAVARGGRVLLPVVALGRAQVCSVTAGDGAAGAVATVQRGGQGICVHVLSVCAVQVAT